MQPEEKTGEFNAIANNLDLTLYQRDFLADWLRTVLAEKERATLEKVRKWAEQERPNNVGVSGRGTIVIDQLLRHLDELSTNE